VNRRAERLAGDPSGSEPACNLCLSQTSPLGHMKCRAVYYVRVARRESHAYEAVDRVGYGDRCWELRKDL
jgi:hypothetical protein